MIQYTTNDRDELRELILIAHEKQQFYMAECEGKYKFNTPDEAKKAIRRSTHDKINPYKCEYCHKWHIGGGVKRHGRSEGEKRKTPRQRGYFDEEPPEEC